MIYELNVGTRGGLWLWPYVAYEWVRSEYDTRVRVASSSGAFYSRPTSSAHLLRFGLLLPLMFHLTESWAIGAGPRVYYDYAIRGYSTFGIGLASQLVGSF